MASDFFWDISDFASFITYMRAFRTTFMSKSTCTILYNSTVTSLTDCKAAGNTYRGNTLNFVETTNLCEVRSCQNRDLQLTLTDNTEVYVDETMFPSGKISLQFE